MKVEDFDFHLPEELIAQTPLENRSESRLMVLDKEDGSIDHLRFKNIVDLLDEGDCLVLNDTRVLPARLFGQKEETGANIEVLLLKQEEGDQWETLVKPAKRVKVGTEVVFGDGKLKATCVGTKDHGGRIMEFAYDGIFYEVLEELGEMPLPPYIKEQLEKNLPGLKVNVKLQPHTQKLALEKKKEYEMSLSRWLPDYPDPMTYLEVFLSGSSVNNTEYANPEYDALIKKIKTELGNDEKARWKAMQEAEKMLLDDAVIAPVFQRGLSYLQKPYVKDLYVHQFGPATSLKGADVQK